MLRVDEISIVIDVVLNTPVILAEYVFDDLQDLDIERLEADQDYKKSIEKKFSVQLDKAIGKRLMTVTVESFVHSGHMISKDMLIYVIYAAIKYIFFCTGIMINRSPFTDLDGWHKECGNANPPKYDFNGHILPSADYLEIDPADPRVDKEEYIQAMIQFVGDMDIIRAADTDMSGCTISIFDNGVKKSELCVDYVKSMRDPTLKFKDNKEDK
jgi:hypothetical protein